MRRADRIAQIEAKYGRPAREVIIEMIEREQSLRVTAQKLDMSISVLYYLMSRLGIELKRVPVSYAS